MLVSGASVSTCRSRALGAHALCAFEPLSEAAAEGPRAASMRLTLEISLRLVSDWTEGARNAELCLLRWHQETLQPLPLVPWPTSYPFWSVSNATPETGNAGRHSLGPVLG